MEQSENNYLRAQRVPAAQGRSVAGQTPAKQVCQRQRPPGQQAKLARGFHPAKRRGLS